jgi:Cdc6-like AAA superfamily ATPase
MAISEFVTTKQTQEALDWITPLHFERQQNDSINQRQEGTGLWLLQSDEFTQWLKQPQQTLFCPGIPGSGKTVMTSIVVEHLRTKFQDNPEVQIGHIFCSYQPTYQQTNLDVLLSLLRQLAVTNCALLPTVEEFHKRHSKSSTRPNADEVRVQLSKTALSYKKVFVVIDALDEYCSFDPEELKTLLSEIFSLQKEAPINFFATSRFISEITECFSCCIVKEIRAQEEDILRYVNKRILLLVRSTISQYPDTQESVRCRLVKCADGM